MIESLDTSLVRSIATPSLADLFGDISEMAIDSVMESGALRDIPIIGMVTGVLKAGSDMRTALFLRKISIFLKTLSKTSDKDRQKFVDEMKEPGQKHKFGEAVLLLLERSENMIKPKLIAKIISACISGKIKEEAAFRICSMIDRCYVHDLEFLKNFKNGTQGENRLIAEALLSAGFLSNGGISGGTFDNGGGRDDSGVIYTMNEYGELLVRYALSCD